MHITKIKVQFVFIMACLMPSLAMALVYPLPPKGSNIIGENQYHVLKKGELLTDITRQYNIGYYELLEANPTMDPMDLKIGSSLLIPTQFILPDAPQKGIVINLAEPRLYYYMADQKSVLTEPIGIGKRGWDTPTGVAKITDHRKNPYWRAPKSVREDMARRGVFIPELTPPGPENPLGDYAMRLSMVGYVIHGTNRPAGVGRRVSAGCFRLYPEGIERLFNQVDVGVDVNILNQVFKAGWSKEGTLYVEVSRPLFEQRQQLKGDKILTLAKDPIENALAQKPAKVDWEKVRIAGQQQLGIPVAITLSSAEDL